MIALSVGGPTTFVSNALDAALLVATADGVATIRRGEDGWRAAERSLHGCHVSSLLIEPRHRLLFAGVYKGGVFVSDDDGATWEARNDGLSEQHVYCLAAAPSDEGVTLYCGTEPAELFRSDDLGRTWRRIPAIRDVPSTPIWNFPSPPFTGHVKSVALDARYPGRMFVGVEQGALLKTEDGGRSFRDLHGFFNDVHRIAIDPADSSSVFISTGAGVYHSLDAGETWSRITTNDTGIGYPDALLIDPRDPKLMFIAGSHATPGTWRKTHTANAHILRSRNGGRDWEILRRGLPEHVRANIEALTMSVAGTACELFAGTTDGDVFTSSDLGESWTSIASGLPPVSKWGHYLALALPPVAR